MPTLQKLNPKPGDKVRRKIAKKHSDGWIIVGDPEGRYMGRKSHYRADHKGILLATGYDDWEIIEKNSFFGINPDNLTDDQIKQLGKMVADEVAKRF